MRDAVENTTNEQFRHSELTKTIIGMFYEVYNELGHGFLESVYENSLAIALRGRKASKYSNRLRYPSTFEESKLAISTPTYLITNLLFLN